MTSGLLGLIIPVPLCSVAILAGKEHLFTIGPGSVFKYLVIEHCHAALCVIGYLLAIIHPCEN
jgi:hypothetical protein